MDDNGKTRVTIAIDAGTLDILRKAAGGRGIGDYVSDLVDSNWHDWQDALGLLTNGGWRGPDLLAACDALNGKLIVARLPLGHQLSGTMMDAAVMDGVAKTHNVGDTWRDRCTQVRDDDTIARALWCVVQEWWRNNKILAREMTAK